MSIRSPFRRQVGVVPDRTPLDVLVHTVEDHLYRCDHVGLLSRQVVEVQSRGEFALGAEESRRVLLLESALRAIALCKGRAEQRVEARQEPLKSKA